MTVEPTDPPVRSTRGGVVTYGVLFGLVTVLGAAVVGTRPLGDNSFLTHLATGRLILDTGKVPSTDPYSYTAPGAPWVVQSWLASVAYGAVERLAGGLGLRLLHIALTSAAGALLWRLSRPVDGILVRLGLVALAVGASAPKWAERPFMFGCLFLAVFLLASQRDLPGPLLLGCAWLWVNTHGSFPLGLVALAALALGRHLDGQAPARELRALRWATAGVVLGGVNPIGPRLLVFPVRLLGRQDVLADVLEWQAPGFQSLADRAFLLLVVAAVVALVRRPSWYGAIPTLVFTASALLGSRNLVFAAMVIVAAAAPSLAGIGELRSQARVAQGRVVVAALGVLGLLVVGQRLSELDDFVLDPRYPVDALALLEQRDVDLGRVHLVSHDFVGNLLTATYEGERVVYFDDRFDMYPIQLVEDAVALQDGEPGWSARLAAVEADVVIWEREAPLAQVLTADPAWASVMADDRWALFCRRGSGLATLGC